MEEIPALIVAAGSGNVDKIQRILSQNADVNVRDAEGNTALHVAARGGQLAAVKKLTEYYKQLDLNPGDQEGRTPKDLAVEWEQDEVVKFMELDNEAGGFAFARGLLPAILRKDTETTKQLLDPADRLGQDQPPRPDVNALDKRKMPLLHHVVKSGSEDILGLVLAEDGLQVNQRDRYGRTALDLAVERHAAGSASDWVVTALKRAGALRGDEVDRGGGLGPQTPSEVEDAQRDGILAAFTRWDTDQSGSIKEEELRRVLGELGMTDDDIRNTFKAADLNQDGKLDYEEFVKWIFGTEAYAAPSGVRKQAGLPGRTAAQEAAVRGAFLAQSAENQVERAEARGALMTLAQSAENQAERAEAQAE